MQKPVKSQERIIKIYTGKNDIVVDRFGGSGTTLVAALSSGRRCFTSDLNPILSEIIYRRGQLFSKTGEQGLPHSSILHKIIYGQPIEKRQINRGWCPTKYIVKYANDRIWEYDWTPQVVSDCTFVPVQDVKDFLDGHSIPRGSRNSLNEFFGQYVPPSRVLRSLCRLMDLKPGWSTSAISRMKADVDRSGSNVVHYICKFKDSQSNKVLLKRTPTNSRIDSYGEVWNSDKQKWEKVNAYIEKVLYKFALKISENRSNFYQSIL